MVDFQKVLVRFSEDEKDVWLVEDAMRGTSIIGGTGSGKTSASGNTIAKQFLKQGWGGVVLCAKNEEVGLWVKYCEDTGRADDLVIFSNDKKHTEGPLAGKYYIFNPIHYELKRGGDGSGEVQNITNIFMNIYRMGNRISGDGDTKEDRFWDAALKRCLNRVVELLKLARENLTYSNMIRVVATSKTVKQDILVDHVYNLTKGIELPEAKRKTNYCLYCMLKAYKNHFLTDDYTMEVYNAFELVEDYFTNGLHEMGDKTRGTVIESFMSLAEPFLSGILSKHFAGETNIWPESTYTDKKIIVLNFPIKEYLDSGIIAQSVFKLMFQQAIERRDTEKYPVPVFLWCDEAQYFVNPYDQIFLTTARSSLTATVFLSQNISNYYAIMGGKDGAASKVDSLMGNLSTKIFHANSDAVTNQYASKLIGDAVSFMSGRGSSQSFFSLSFQTNKDLRPQFLPQIQPKDFTDLRGGGDSNNLEVDAVVFVTGKQWSTGTNFKRIIFKQEKRKKL